MFFLVKIFLSFTIANNFKKQERCLMAIDQELFICERRQSICFQQGNIFRKYFKFANKEFVEREGTYSRYFEAMGLYTPHFLESGYSHKKKLFFNEYNFHYIMPINTNMISQFEFLTIVSSIKSFANLCSEKNDLYYWMDQYLPEINDAVSYTDYYYGTRIRDYVKQFYHLKIVMPMHGDMTFENIGIDQKNGEYIIFDFGNSGCGVPKWDVAYIIGSSPLRLSKSIYPLIAKKEKWLEMITIVSAIRLGRSLRKNDCSIEKEKIFLYWKGMLEI